MPTTGEFGGSIKSKNLMSLKSSIIFSLTYFVSGKLSVDIVTFCVFYQAFVLLLLKLRVQAILLFSNLQFSAWITH
jgi:hypothetical protein